uniref:Uncharacterized protein n=1 Tax=Oryza glumipatula TaxID=40148 RepID=A0A0D9Z1D7_9ORYZ
MRLRQVDQSTLVDLSTSMGLRRINGKWDDSYDLLPTYREELLRSVPSSLDELDSKECNGDVCFTRWKGKWQWRCRWKGKAMKRREASFMGKIT